MGVRLVVHNFELDSMDYTGTHNHDEMLHRDWVDQHPIYAITGLQEVLNTIESNLVSITNLLLEKEQSITTNCNNYTDISISDLSNSLTDTINNLEVIEDALNTDTIDLNYNRENKTLSADVKIFDDKNKTNRLISTENGLYVYGINTVDSKSVYWNIDDLDEDPLTIFNNGIRFSHNDTNVYNNLYNPSEANAWIWDDELSTIKQPITANSYNGIISERFYDNYQHSVRIVSEGEENNANGIILGFVFDENNNPHTLSAMIQRNDSIYLSYRFAVIYNFQLPGQELVYNYNLSNSNGNWTLAPNGISLYATKNKNVVKVSATSWNYVNNSTDITEASHMTFENTINVNLDNYSWGHYFKEEVRVGYSNLLQENTYFDHIFLHSERVENVNLFSCNVRINDDENNNIKITDKGLYSEKFLISQYQDNAIIKKEDGYYVQAVAMAVSNQRLNGLEKIDNEYYVHKSHSYINVNQENHEFIVGDFIYFDNRTNTYLKALAKDDFDINIIGMVSYIQDENNFEYICSGFVETDLFSEENGYIQGMPLYISDSTAGTVTQNQPNISKTVGYPINNNGLIISIERGIQYNKEAQIGDFKTTANDYNIRSDGFIKVKENIQYKLSIMNKLLSALTQSFKESYLIIDEENNILEFINTSELYEQNMVPSSMNLFIKAF